MGEAAVLRRIEDLEGQLELLLGERRAAGLLRAEGVDPSADYDLANKQYVDEHAWPQNLCGIWLNSDV